MMTRANRATRSTVLLALVASLCTVAEADRKRQVRFIGVHPVAASDGGGSCYIEGPHVHLYPIDKLQYRDHDGWSFFVGDPVAYGYDGPKHAYKGHHPIHVHAVVGDDATDVEHCYLDGPHYHPFAPPPGPDFKLVGGAHFYVGTPVKAYVDARPVMIGINAVYKPRTYARPVVTVEAPAGWIGVRIDIVVPQVIIPIRPVPVIIEHRHRKMKHKKWKRK